MKIDKIGEKNESEMEILIFKVNLEVKSSLVIIVESVNDSQGLLAQRKRETGEMKWK